MERNSLPPIPLSGFGVLPGNAQDGVAMHACGTCWPCGVGGMMPKTSGHSKRALFFRTPLLSASVLSLRVTGTGPVRADNQPVFELRVCHALAGRLPALEVDPRFQDLIKSEPAAPPVTRVERPHMRPTDFSPMKSCRFFFTRFRRQDGGSPETILTGGNS
jgi:hypothetical protein